MKMISQTLPVYLSIKPFCIHRPISRYIRVLQGRSNRSVELSSVLSTLLPYLTLLITLVGSPGITTCQSFSVDSVHVLEYDAGYLKPSALSTVCIADGQVYFPVSKDENKLIIHKFDIASRKDTTLTFRIANTLLDPRQSIRGIIKKGDRIAVWSNGLVEFEVSSGKVKQEIDDPLITEARFGGEGQVAVSHLYYQEGKRQEGTIIVYEGKKRTARTVFNPGHFQLTRFNPNHLFDMTKDHVVRCAVSSPEIFLYNSDLELLDSLKLNFPVWKDADDLISEDVIDNARSNETDFFSFYFKLFEQGLSKNLSIRFIDDQTLLLVFLLSNQTYGCQLITINEAQELIASTPPTTLHNGFCLDHEGSVLIPKDRCFPGVLLASAWPCSEGEKLFFVNWGYDALPYTITCEQQNEIMNSPNLDRRQWLHLFEVSIHIP